ncbi:hypothetical protein KIPB_001916 [Kipferlia bialata]|uniref:Uncharacterized protein n=1 Tax=Kipferlia bialata TaxID=797122 RepID=A0A9K3CRJ3_9EUKA|nr:hypothetical protein KIPB_001916 [Kipferlia bialata]|eukprot:g1916.t1
MDFQAPPSLNRGGGSARVNRQRLPRASASQESDNAGFSATSGPMRRTYTRTQSLVRTEGNGGRLSSPKIDKSNIFAPSPVRRTMTHSHPYTPAPASSATATEDAPQEAKEAEAPVAAAPASGSSPLPAARLSQPPPSGSRQERRPMSRTLSASSSGQGVVAHLHSPATFTERAPVPTGPGYAASEVRALSRTPSVAVVDPTPVDPALASDSALRTASRITLQNMPASHLMEPSTPKAPAKGLEMPQPEAEAEAEGETVPSPGMGLMMGDLEDVGEEDKTEPEPEAVAEAEAVGVDVTPLETEAEVAAEPKAQPQAQAQGGASLPLNRPTAILLGEQYSACLYEAMRGEMECAEMRDHLKIVSDPAFMAAVCDAGEVSNLVVQEVLASRPGCDLAQPTATTIAAINKVLSSMSGRVERALDTVLDDDIMNYMQHHPLVVSVGILHRVGTVIATTDRTDFVSRLLGVEVVRVCGRYADGTAVQGDTPEAEATKLTLNNHSETDAEGNLHDPRLWPIGLASSDGGVPEEQRDYVRMSLGVDPSNTLQCRNHHQLGLALAASAAAVTDSTLPHCVADVPEYAGIYCVIRVGRGADPRGLAAQVSGILPIPPRHRVCPTMSVGPGHRRTLGVFAEELSKYGASAAAIAGQTMRVVE